MSDPLVAESLPPPVGYHRLAQRAGGAWWRLFVSILAAAVGLVIGTVVAVLLVIAGAWAVGDTDFTLDLNDGINAAEMLATNLGLAFLIPISALLYWAIYRIHPRWLLSTQGRLRWRWLVVCIGIALVVWALFLVLGTVSAYMSRDSPLDLQVVAFLVVVICTTPLQAAGEEFLFRGLLLQALGATRLPTWVCCVVSGALFATAHLQFDPPLFADRFLLGIVLAWLAIRTGGLEAGIAIHLAKNLSALIPAALLDEVSDALDPSGVTWVPLVLDIVLLAIVVPWMVGTFRRRMPPGGAPPPLIAGPHGAPA
jgi:membrane protease YdiL (CAAX protease family)